MQNIWVGILKYLASVFEKKVNILVQLIVMITKKYCQIY